MNMYDSILVPIDGSEHALEAFKVAKQLASSGADIHLVNVPELPPATDELGRWVEASNLNVHRTDAEEEAYKLLERTRDSIDQSGVEVHTNVHWGPPANAIVAEAERLGVDAIVMGSRGISDLKGLVVGSVSHRVMHSAPCRVILVR